jgi:hypothetical protein
MDGMPDAAKYRYPESCRKRAYKAKLKSEAEAVGLKVAPTLRDVEAARGTRARARDAEKPAKRPQRRRPGGVTASYRKALEELTARLPPEWHPIVRLGLLESLSPRARKQVLEQQRTEAA